MGVIVKYQKVVEVKMVSDKVMELVCFFKRMC